MSKNQSPSQLPLSAMQIRNLQKALVHWFDEAQRELPWRDDPNPYYVLVSEIMAQQTRLAAVMPYFTRFIKRFPTVFALAAAQIDDVLALWSGLGYYRRAHNLHRAARMIVEEHNGQFPQTVAELIALPGVGRYTAGAIASIAFERPEPILDGNIMRVFARLFDIDSDIASTATRKTMWRIAEALLPKTRVSAFNQGLMELGALVCTPQNPTCSDCPLRRYCLALQNETVALRPQKKSKTDAPSVYLLAQVVRHRDGSLLLVKNPAGGLFAGLWQLPMREIAGNAVKSFTPDIVHELTHRRLLVALEKSKLRDIDLTRYPDHRWVSSPAELPQMGVASLTKKLLHAVGFFAE